MQVRVEKCTWRFGLRAELMIKPGRYNDNWEDKVNRKRHTGLSGSGYERISRRLYILTKCVGIYKELNML
jgi:hypothetical protein